MGARSTPVFAVFLAVVGQRSASIVVCVFNVEQLCVGNYETFEH